VSKAGGARDMGEPPASLRRGPRRPRSGRCAPPNPRVASSPAPPGAGGPSGV